MRETDVREGVVPAVAGIEAASESDKRAVVSISNWAFAWLFGLADFGEEDEE